MGRRFRRPARADIAHKHFAFVNAHIRIGYETGQIIGDTSDRFAGIAPVEGQANLMNDSAVHV